MNILSLEKHKVEKDENDGEIVTHGWANWATRMIKISDYNDSESEDNYQTAQYSKWCLHEEEQYSDATCVRCNYTFTCPVTYQGNQPICTTCSAELRH